MPKHSRDEYEEPPPKRRKYDKAPNIVERMEVIMDELPLKYVIKRLIYEIPQKMLESGTSEAKVRSELEEFGDHCRSIASEVTAEMNSLTVQPNGGTHRDLRYCLRSFDELLSLTEDLQDFLFFKPLPSAYALVSNWRNLQTYPRPILCLRPADKHGIPLTLLHSIFSRFHLLSCQPLPNSSPGANALRVASRLCSHMGDAFEDEQSRSKAFDVAVGDFLQGVDGSRRLHGHKVYGDADRVYRVDGHCDIIREDKVEIGTAGDAYTQVARSYDLACEQMEKNGVIPDAPVFLLCVMGPTLTIAGGFKDNEDTVVEPLCPMLFMLKDMDSVNGRVMQLATHLFALQACLEQLPLLPNPPSPVSGVPRVFPSFRDANGTEYELTFQRRLSKDQHLFHAVDNNSRQLCVKIVYGSYGEEVHRVLGDAKMAPGLLGVSRIKDGPTMIVMEMLDDSWETLYTFAHRNSRWTADGVKPTIRKRLEEILAKLEGEGLVHGDFRSNNIMVKSGEEESAVVIDFDWAGKDGEVHYPLYRNDEGVWWPSEIGSAIRLGHDRSMLESEWASILRPWTVR